MTLRFALDWVEAIEQTRRRSISYVEDFVIEFQSNMM